MEQHPFLVGLVFELLSQQRGVLFFVVVGLYANEAGAFVPVFLFQQANAEVAVGTPVRGHVVLVPDTHLPIGE